MRSSPFARPAPQPRGLRVAGRVSFASALLGLLAGPAEAHHDAADALPLSLNTPGAVGGLTSPAERTETRFGFLSRAFRVNDNPLYGAALGGDALVLWNGLFGNLSVTPQLSLEALVPLVTDLPDDQESRTGLGDVRLGVRWFHRVSSLDATMALGAEGSLPTGDAARGFGADAVVTRTSGRLIHDLPRPRMRIYGEAGVAWTWAERRGTLADAALAALWQPFERLGFLCEARVLTALEQGRAQALAFVGQTRQAGDTTLVITPALTLALGRQVGMSVGPQIPLGFKDFDFGVTAAVGFSPGP